MKAANEKIQKSLEGGEASTAESESREEEPSGNIGHTADESTETPAASTAEASGATGNSIIASTSRVVGSRRATTSYAQ